MASKNCVYYKYTFGFRMMKKNFDLKFKKIMLINKVSKEKTLICHVNFNIVLWYP